MGRVAQYRTAWLASAAAVVLAGCATQAARTPVPSALASQAVIPGLAHARFWGDETPTNIVAFAQAHMPNAKAMAAKDQRGRPLVEYLAISGGAGDGAFAAGLLTGWSKRGDRPQFEVVTGVSAGALTAPFAYLGSAYDDHLRQIWTKYQTEDLATPQVLAGLFGAEAFADSSGLAGLIAKYIDRKLLDRIAEEYRHGRVLLVATTNLDAQRPVIWNMGEIAASRHAYALDLFRQVILASASVPGVFAPVHITVRAGDKLLEEMHVDGGPTRQVVVAPAQLSLKSFDRLYAKPPLRRIYIVKNGKLTPEYEAVASNTLAISARSVFTLTKSQSIGDINRIYAMTQRDGAEFRLASIPASFNAPSTQVFDRTYMQALFQEGYRLGSQGEPWARTPPELGATVAAR
jgi:predicted acylesterase/phospholipase RssA